MSRGNAGQRVFDEADEWRGFLQTLEQTKLKCPFNIYAYCLMSNHFHLLLRVQEVPLSAIMHRLLTASAIRFNLPRDRMGHVFQGRYTAILCQSDIYFKHLLRYIHLNPVKAGLAHRPEEWPWSSHREYLKPRAESFLDVAGALKMFDPDIERGALLYERFLQAGLTDPMAMNEELPSLDVAAETCEFLPKSRAAPPPIDRLAREVCDHTGITIGGLRGRSRPREVSRARREFAIAAFTSGYGIRRIAAYLGLSPSVISRALKKQQVNK